MVSGLCWLDERGARGSSRGRILMLLGAYGRRVWLCGICEGRREAEGREGWTGDAFANFEFVTLPQTPLV